MIDFASFSRISISPKRRLVVISFTLHTRLALIEHLGAEEVSKKLARSKF